MEKEEGGVAEGRRKGVQGTGDHSFTASTYPSPHLPPHPLCHAAGTAQPTQTREWGSWTHAHNDNISGRGSLYNKYGTQAGLGRGRISYTPTPVF